MGVSKPTIWQSYFEWLRLMVVHFEAIWTVANYTNDQGDKFDTAFRIVNPPYTTSKLL